MKKVAATESRKSLLMREVQVNIPMPEGAAVPVPEPRNPTTRPSTQDAQPRSAQPKKEQR